MSKDKASLFAEGFKVVSDRMDAALINFTKSMNEAAKALSDFRANSSDVNRDSKGDDNE